LTLSQRRFLVGGGKPGDQTWSIPLCVRAGDGSGGEEKKCTLLATKSATVELAKCPAWLLANAGAAGYFRVAYDGAALKALLPVFAGKLDVRERVRVAQDVAAQAEQGSLPLADALTLVPALLADPDLRPFRAGVALLDLIHPAEQPAAQQKAYARMVTKLLGPRAQAAGWAPKEGEDPMMSEVRPLLWHRLARWSDNREGTAEARRLAQAWLSDRKAVAPDMVQTVLNLAARGGDAAFFDTLLAEAKRVSDRRERGQLLAALGMFRDPKLLQRALGLMSSTELDLRETMEVLEGAFFEPRSRDAAWAYLKAHWEPITTRLRSDQTMWLVEAVPREFCDPGHRKEVAAFFTARAEKHPGAAHVLAESLEHADVCVAAVKRGKAAAAQFLGAY
jgi:alanyl aminopeptidase